jgi:hypothetical protein
MHDRCEDAVGMPRGEPPREVEGNSLDRERDRGEEDEEAGGDRFRCVRPG